MAGPDENGADAPKPHLVEGTAVHAMLHMLNNEYANSPNLGPLSGFMAGASDANIIVAIKQLPFIKKLNPDPDQPDNEEWNKTRLNSKELAALDKAFEGQPSIVGQAIKEAIAIDQQQTNQAFIDHMKMAGEEIRAGRNDNSPEHQKRADAALKLAEKDLANGADINSQIDYGHGMRASVLEDAARNGNTQSVAFLIQHSAGKLNLNGTDASGTTILSEISDPKHPGSPMELLLKNAGAKTTEELVASAKLEPAAEKAVVQQVLHSNEFAAALAMSGFQVPHGMLDKNTEQGVHTAPTENLRAKVDAPMKTSTLQV